MNKSTGEVASGLAAMMMIVGLMLVGPSTGWAQQKASSADGVKAASQAFYAALVGTDVAAMKKVWAHTPYVAYVGPRMKTIAHGWAAVEKALEEAFSASMSRTVSLTESHVHTDGKLAWEIGNEVGAVKLKDGKEIKIDIIVTNVFEKQKGGRWLMISHHVQPKPQ